jgi:hypothetical protein
MKKLTISVALTSMMAFSAAANAAATINPNTLELKVNDKPFFMRGMNYSPETRGWNTIPNGGTSNQFTSKGPQGQDHSKGVWLCTLANEYAAVDYESSCRDNDLTGLLTGPTSYNLNTNYNEALKKRWERDLTRLQSIGVNTIRLYDVQAGKEEGKLLKNHKPFLDLALKKGIYVIFPALTDYVKNNDGGPEGITVKASVTNLVKETCGHPAVIAYNVGNEFPHDAATFSKVKQAISLTRQLCPNSLITYSTEDDPGYWAVNDGKSRLLETLGNVAGPNKSNTGIDFLLLNEYRNEANGGVAGPYPAMFAQMKKLAETYRVPVAIGETGEYDNQRFNPNWYNDEWKYILNNAKDNYVLGSLYFAYHDEPIKKGTLDNQHFMGIVTAAWPSATTSFESFADPDDVVKDKNYTGIPDFTDPIPDPNTGLKTTIRYPNSKVGVGRFDMFSDTSRCNYLTGQDLSPTTGPCAK